MLELVVEWWQLSRFPAKMTLIHACALIYQGRDTADICRSAPVKLFILIPEKGGLYAPDLGDILCI